MSLRYRPEIDGMRAVAVVSVIVYHLKLPRGDGYLLSGGFLGVDLFFVLSGFLITGILLTEFDATGRIGLRAFYLRRARRILPALVLVMLASIPAAWAILMPSELERYSGSLVASLLFFSNVFWFFEQGSYGAQSALLQPFLHTWSLAIEEQFYLVFPLAFAAIAPRRRAGPVIAVALAVALAVAQISTLGWQHLSFFSTLSRAWELLAGALLAWASIRHPALPGRLPGARLLPAAGLALVLVPIWSVRLNEVAHPGFGTLPTVLGTCLMIRFADPREPVTRLLSSRAFTLIGTLSYSLYLWHYPVFAFGREISVVPTPLEKAGWVALTVALSALGYVLVEKPFRFRLAPRVLFGSLGASAVVVAAFFAATLLNGGFASRFGDLAAIYAGNEFDNEVLQEQTWSVLDGLAGDERIGKWNAQQPSEHEADHLWFSDADRQNVLVVGNSHSRDLFNALYMNRDAFPDMEFARFTLATGLRAGQVDRLLRSPNFRAADVILFTSRYHNMPIRKLPGFLAEIRRLGKPVALVGNSAEFELRGELPLFDWYLRTNGAGADLDEVNRIAYRFEASYRFDDETALRPIARDLGIPFLSRRALTCDDRAGTCTLVTPSGRKAFYDTGHWTLDGARHFGREAARTGWLDVIAGPGAR